MNRTKRIKNILENFFNDHTIIVRDNSYLHKGHNNFDGNNQTHISVQLKKNSKLELNRLEIHRKINSLLSEEFDNGLHSLEIKII
jgi:stress-induced morphogen